MLKNEIVHFFERPFQTAVVVSLKAITVNGSVTSGPGKLMSVRMKMSPLLDFQNRWRPSWTATLEILCHLICFSSRAIFSRPEVWVSLRVPTSSVWLLALGRRHGTAVVSSTFSDASSCFSFTIICIHYWRSAISSGLIGYRQSVATPLMVNSDLTK